MLVDFWVKKNNKMPWHQRLEGKFLKAESCFLPLGYISDFLDDTLISQMKYWGTGWAGTKLDSKLVAERGPGFGSPGPSEVILPVATLCHPPWAGQMEVRLWLGPRDCWQPALQPGGCRETGAWLWSQVLIWLLVQLLELAESGFPLWWLW